MFLTTTDSLKYSNFFPYLGLFPAPGPQPIRPLWPPLLKLIASLDTEVLQQMSDVFSACFDLTKGGRTGYLRSVSSGNHPWTDLQLVVGLHWRTSCWCWVIRSDHRNPFALQPMCPSSRLINVNWLLWWKILSPNLTALPSLLLGVD